MPTDKITCPKCHFSFAIEAALTEGIEEQVRAQLKAQFKAEQTKTEDQWKEKLAAREQEMEDKLEAERRRLLQQAEKKARDDTRMQLESLQTQLTEKNNKLAAAEKQELQIRREKAALEERARRIELEVQRKLDTQRQEIAEKAAAEAAEQHRLKDAEKDRRIDDMIKKIDDLQRRAEQGSVQAQGEVLELDIETQLSSTFRMDTIEPVAKGRRGGDIIQTVNSSQRQAAGTILWELKNTKAWSDSWLEKARQDQRQINAEVVVIVSEALPKNLKLFGEIENVWVCDRSCAMGLAAALRAGILKISEARAANEDRGSKMADLYHYLADTAFRQTVEAIQESFSTMRQELDSEKRAMERMWASRQKQLERVIQSTAAMYGDLQGIIGSKVLPTVPMLKLPAPETEMD